MGETCSTDCNRIKNKITHSKNVVQEHFMVSQGRFWGFMRVSIVSMGIWGFEERSEMFLRVCGGFRMVSVNCKGCSTGGFKVSEELQENWRDV